MQEQLRALDPTREVEIVTIKTSGDKGDRDKLGAFVREIQDSLLRREIDVAVHCLKDLPTQGVPGLVLAAHLDREDPRETLISRGPELDELAVGSVVGTGSVRRTSQLAARRRDLIFKPLIGNVDTRLSKLIAGDYDAIVLAMAGLKRLGIVDNWQNSDYRELVLQPMSCTEMVPCPGQAVLVLETREDESGLASALNHKESELATRAERTYLREFGGGCSIPVGAYARPTNLGLTMDVWVSTVDGQESVRNVASGPLHEPEALAATLLNDSKGREARKIISRIHELNARGAGN